MSTNTAVSVESEIGFADGKITSIQRNGDRLVVTVRAWNALCLEVVFNGVIGLRESMAGDISDLIVSPGRGDFWEWCRSRAYEGLPPNHDQHFQFIDNSEEVSLEVVAESVEVCRK